MAEGWNCAILSDLSDDPALDVIEAVVDTETAIVEIEDVDRTLDSLEFEEDIEEPATLIDNPRLGAPPSDLAALIKQDLDKLDTTLDGRLQAQIAAYSDLNADDIDDALVLFSYDSPQPAYRQFLAAYLFDGETYRLTATKPIAGSSTDTKNAIIDHVEQGVIRITLEAFQPGDDSCCPSGVREIALAFRNLELVEVDEGAPTR